MLLRLHQTPLLLRCPPRRYSSLLLNRDIETWKTVISMLCFEKIPREGNKLISTAGHTKDPSEVIQVRDGNSGTS